MDSNIIDYQISSTKKLEYLTSSRLAQFCYLLASEMLLYTYVCPIFLLLYAAWPLFLYIAKAQFLTPHFPPIFLYHIHSIQHPRVNSYPIQCIIPRSNHETPIHPPPMMLYMWTCIFIRLIGLMQVYVMLLNHIN